MILCGCLKKFICHLLWFDGSLSTKKKINSKQKQENKQNVDKNEYIQTQSDSQMAQRYTQRGSLWGFVTDSVRIVLLVQATNVFLDIGLVQRNSMKRIIFPFIDWELYGHFNDIRLLIWANESISLLHQKRNATEADRWRCLSSFRCKLVLNRFSLSFRLNFRLIFWVRSGSDCGIVLSLNLLSLFSFY